MADVIPLPDLGCACPDAAKGRHATTCQPAIDLAKSDLRDRPEYVEGARFQAVNWDYPYRMSIEIRVDVNIDIALFLADHADEYARFEPDGAYQSWEKPEAFLHHLAAEQVDVLTPFDVTARNVASAWVDVDHVEIHPILTADTAPLLEPAPPPPAQIPGQTSLDDDQ